MTTPTSASAALSPATSPALSAAGRAASAPGGTTATVQGRAPRRKISIPLLRRSRRRDLVEVPARADVLALCSVLLGYPDEALYADLDLLGEAVAALPASAPAAHLAVFWRAFTDQTPAQARAHYVETFDLRRRSSLFLSYYLHGDTRQRGMALLSLKQRYRACGFTPEEGELPDYLPMVLEFASRAGTGAGEGVLRAHRPGIEPHPALPRRPWLLVPGDPRGRLGPARARLRQAPDRGRPAGVLRTTERRRRARDRGHALRLRLDRQPGDTLRPARVHLRPGRAAAVTAVAGPPENPCSPREA